MGYCQFLSGLFEDGRIIVPAWAPLAEDEIRVGDETIAAVERRYRLEMPGTAPEFDADAGRWAATRFFRACQAAVYRDIPEAALDKELGPSCPIPPEPKVHYSVDIVFRYLPDLVKFAASAAENDPLVKCLFNWAHDWPLSSVGIEEVRDVTIDAFAEEPALRQLYADRIIAAGDRSRLSDPRADEAIRCTLGMYPTLAGSIGTAFENDGIRETIE